MTVTTYNKPKAFAWSYSKLKNYESCPKRHWHIDIKKDVKEEESEHLRYGNLLHEALAKSIGSGEALPPAFKHLEPWVEKLSGGAGVTLVEQKYAIRSDFSATEFFARDAWFRGIGDVVKIAGPVGLILDWKTGKIVEDSVQLALMAQCVFAHFPDVQKVRTEFVWLKEDATTRADFSRDDMRSLWASLLPRVRMLEDAHNGQNYPPKPGPLCRRWCPVTACPHHGS